MNNSIIRTLIQDLQNRKEYNLAFQLQRNLMTDELNNRQEREQLKKEIVDEVMSKIKIYISSDTTAINEMSKAIKNLIN